MSNNMQYDIVVCGAGPAGIGAALSSARMGAKTLLIEKDGAVGGVSTVGMMSHWTGSVNSKLYREVISRACLDEGREVNDAKYINTECLKITLLKMLKEANCDLLLYTFVTDVIIEAQKTKGVVTASKSGTKTINSKVIVDATGDGDIANYANVPFVLGREQDNKMQPMTLMFKVGGVDDDRAVYLGCFEEKHYTDKGEIQELAKKILPHPAGHVLLMKTPQKGVVSCNMTNCIGVDGTNAEDLTRAEIECRLQINAIISFLREYVEGYENCFLLATASSIGVRETRHIKGLYTLNEIDVEECIFFDDWIVRGAKFNFDIHNLDGSGLDKNGLQLDYKQKEEGYYIPYRCLVPLNVEGLLLAGRCISGTHKAHSNYRAMPICLAMGEAAGIAASIVAETNCGVKGVLVDDIQKRLM